ncbi:uncharacterized protein ACRADG_001872 isoform 2-T2 [Cochliomyia hominivorax]
MDLNDVRNKELFSSIVINELKIFGVKYQKTKKKKHVQNNTYRTNIFRTDLNLLDLTDVILSNGRVVQIPKFVAHACNHILEQVETEGIFRKAGSFVRQKEIRNSIESGVELGKSHHVIDVANVIKYFFRELPEPLIPMSIQETLLRSLLVGEKCVETILLSCLLLPLLTINTLSFFMQFLYTVSLSEKLNKMSVENLAIIFTPGLMPFSDINSHRFKNHVKIVRILIENSNLIGVIPKNIEYKLQEHLSTTVIKINLSDQSAAESNVNENGSKAASAKKKKKRRSEMFNGLKKIVGTAMGSSEFLDTSIHENKNDSDGQKRRENIKITHVRNFESTPCTKENKKRKFEHVVKRKKETKKTRLSLGGGRHTKSISLNPDVTSTERRWSIVGSGWSKSKNKNIDKNCFASNTCLFDVKSSYENTTIENKSQFSQNTCRVQDNSEDTCKNHFDIKEKVTMMESSSSNNLRVINKELLQDSPISINITEKNDPIQLKCEKIILESDALPSPLTENLTQRFRRNLNIRQSIDKQIILSPSPRKIGTIRQRSNDKKRASRNSSWHISSSEQYSLLEVKPKDEIDSNIFYIKRKSHCQIINSNKIFSIQNSTVKNPLDIFSNQSLNEEWVSGEEFFNNNLSHAGHVTTPLSSKNYFDENKTPMLPPKSLPRKISNVRTPLNTVIKPATTSKVPFVNRIVVSTPVIEEVSGRASIARLRTQNAGMVLAKAKLFDGLENNERQTLQTDQHSVEIPKKTNTVHSNFNSILPIKESDVNSLETKSKTTKNSTPISKRIRVTNFNSPASSLKKRQRCNTTKYPRRQILKSDENLKHQIFDGHSLNLDNASNISINTHSLKISVHWRHPQSPRKSKKIAKN